MCDAGLVPTGDAVPDSMWYATLVERRADPTSEAATLRLRVPDTLVPEFDDLEPRPVAARERHRPPQRNNLADLGCTAAQFAAAVYRHRCADADSAYRRQRSSQARGTAWSLHEERAFLLAVQEKGDRFALVRKHAAPVLNKFTLRQIKSKWLTFLRSNVHTPTALRPHLAT